MAITTRGLAKLASIRAYDHTPHATAATAAKTARGAIPPVRRYTLSDASMTVSDNTTPVVLDPKTKSGRTRAEIEQSLKRLDRIALLMDDQFEIPIIKKRIGLDPIIGLIPGGGDWVVWFVSVYVFWEAARLGAPLPLLVRMASNIAVDLLGKPPQRRAAARSLRRQRGARRAAACRAARARAGKPQPRHALRRGRRLDARVARDRLGADRFVVLVDERRLMLE